LLDFSRRYPGLGRVAQEKLVLQILPHPELSLPGPFLEIGELAAIGEGEGRFHGGEAELDQYSIEHEIPGGPPKGEKSPVDEGLHFP